jgi:hypothetical protein
MKMLKVTALALCLNVPMAHANEDDVHFCHMMYKISLYGVIGSFAATGLGCTIVGMRRISSAISTPTDIPLLAVNQRRNASPQISQGLREIGMGTLITTGSLVGMVVIQAIGNTCDNWASNDSNSQ